ncbi:MAG: SDR family oxidoreductase [Kineosporiaceae bacterium]
MPSTVVLGAGPGLGIASARAFARSGHGVGLVARSAERVAAAVDELRAAGHRAHGRAADAADPEGLAAALRELVGELGGLDVLHHNVSRFRAGGVAGTAPGDLADDLAAGAVSLLTAVRAVLPELEATTGTVLATGSGAADRPPADALTLGPQKAALRALVHALAADLAPRGVAVRTLTVRGVIAPGTAFDPDRIAARLAALAADPAASPVESDYSG